MRKNYFGWLTFLFLFGSGYLTVQAQTGFKPVKKYGVKSGIIEYKVSMMGMSNSNTLYFDDYGIKEATESMSQIFGQKTHTITFFKDGYSYTVDFIKKTATKMKMDEEMMKNINYLELTEEVLKQMKITRLGKETILGKECEKLSIDNADLNMKGIIWVWEGITLKSEMTTMGMKQVTEATSIQTGVAVPASKFEVPQGFTITEEKIPAGFPGIDE